MSHELEKSNDMIYANYETPWHGLGVAVDDLFTSQEALEKADLDFEVVKKPLYRQVINQDDSGLITGTDFIEIPDKFEIVRTDIDKHLGVVGNYYQPFQNRQAFDWLDSLSDVSDHPAMFDTAGALFGGRKVWMLIKVDGFMNVKGDAVQKFLLCTNSHDGSSPIMVKFTPVRVVCNNTLTAALGQYKQDSMTLKIRHTKSAESKMDEAARILGLASKHFEKLNEIYGEMANFKITPKLLQKYYKTIMPDPVKKKIEKNERGELVEVESAGNSKRVETIREQLTQIFEESPAIKGTSAAGNLWGAYNSITEYVQYYKVVPNAGKVEGQRFNITVVDSNSGAQELRNNAFKVALNMMN